MALDDGEERHLLLSRLARGPRDTDNPVHVHVLAETKRHAGHADVVRELIGTTEMSVERHKHHG